MVCLHSFHCVMPADIFWSRLANSVFCFAHLRDASAMHTNKNLDLALGTEQTLSKTGQKSRKGKSQDGGDSPEKVKEEIKIEIIKHPDGRSCSLCGRQDNSWDPVDAAKTPPIYTFLWWCKPCDSKGKSVGQEP